MAAVFYAISKLIETIKEPESKLEVKYNFFSREDPSSITTIKTSYLND